MSQENIFENKFYVDDRVLIHSTTSKDLDGERGVVLGYYAEGYCIVLLDKPVEGQKAIVLTQHCLKFVPRHA